MKKVLEAADGEKKKKNHGYSEAMLFPISPGVAMTAQEIAETADITVMTVWNRYRNGLRGKELLQKRNTRGMKVYEVVECPECGKKFRQDRSHLVYCPKCMHW